MVIVKRFLQTVKSQDEEALAEFRELKSAYAAFYTGQIYKRLALDERSASPVGEVASKVPVPYLRRGIK